MLFELSSAGDNVRQTVALYREITDTVE